jgi:inorganic pyrophosphatase
VVDAVNLLHDLPARDDDNLLVVVEVPAGSRVKLKYDAEREVFTWSRALTVGVSFPWDYGFVPRTRAPDGDALDVLVYSHAGATAPGVVVPARVIGALRVEQRRGRGPVKRNDRVLVVPADEKLLADVADAADLPRRAREEIEEFFRASLALTGKDARLRGWSSAAEAERMVTAAVRRYGAGASGARARPARRRR